VGSTGHLGGRVTSFLLDHCDGIVQPHVRTVSDENLWPSDLVTSFGDLQDPETGQRALRGVSTILYLASRGHSSANIPSVSEVETEVRTAVNFARCAARQGVKRFIIVSSLHIYGTALRGQVTEKTTPRPLRTYGIGQLQVENHLMEISRQSEMSVVIVRLTNTFGVPLFPRAEVWRLFIHDICLQLLRTHKIVLTSNGTLFRDFLTVSDACSAIAAIVGRSESASGTLLIGSGATKTLWDVAQQVRMFAASELNIQSEIFVNQNDTSTNEFFSLSPATSQGLDFVPANNWDQELAGIFAAAKRGHTL